MIPDVEIALIQGQPALLRESGWFTGVADSIERLLAERELLVAEHESLGPDRKPAHDAVERFL